MSEFAIHTISEYEDILRRRGLIKDSDLQGKGDEPVRNLTYDSREVTAGTLFVCKGAAFKEKYLKDAAAAGAVCYISEKKYAAGTDIPSITVSDIRKTMAVLANFFYGNPWEDLDVIAVGGTKGKTTSVYYMKSVMDEYLSAQGKGESAVISSVDIYDGKTKMESNITTPEAMELQRHLRNAADSGIECVQMEVSSQGLKYDRVAGMKFDISVFLNISEDHISPVEHKDFEDYISSKLKMFDMTDVAVVNLDADCIDRIMSAARKAGKVITFSAKDEKADYCLYDVKKAEHGISFKVKSEAFDEEFHLSMPGLFNAENATAVIAAATEMNVPLKYIKEGLKKAHVSGRMEMFATADKKILVMVDYAHNKLSFEKLFSSAKKEYPDRDIYAVFGSSGGKALIRRKSLGSIAGKYADKVYFTSDDPGTEPFEHIVEELAGYVKKEGTPYEAYPYRADALEKAIKDAEMRRDNRGTVILITGKGAETSQKIGNEFVYFPSDVENAKRLVSEYDDRNRNANI